MNGASDEAALTAPPRLNGNGNDMEQTDMGDHKGNLKRAYDDALAARGLISVRRSCEKLTDLALPAKMQRTLSQEFLRQQMNPIAAPGMNPSFSGGGFASSVPDDPNQTVSNNVGSNEGRPADRGIMNGEQSAGQPPSQDGTGFAGGDGAKDQAVGATCGTVQSSPFVAALMWILSSVPVDTCSMAVVLSRVSRTLWVLQSVPSITYPCKVPFLRYQHRKVGERTNEDRLAERARRTQTCEGSVISLCI